MKITAGCTRLQPPCTTGWQAMHLVLSARQLPGTLAFVPVSCPFPLPRSCLILCQSLCWSQKPAVGALCRYDYGLQGLAMVGPVSGAGTGRRWRSDLPAVSGHLPRTWLPGLPAPETAKRMWSTRLIEIFLWALAIYLGYCLYQAA